MKHQRQICRVCSAPAGFTRNICSGCFAAEVEQRELESAGRDWHPSERRQRAYSQTVAVVPVAAR